MQYEYCITTIYNIIYIRIFILTDIHLRSDIHTYSYDKNTFYYHFNWDTILYRQRDENILPKYCYVGLKEIDILKLLRSANFRKEGSSRLM